MGVSTGEVDQIQGVVIRQSTLQIFLESVGIYFIAYLTLKDNGLASSIMRQDARTVFL